MPNYAYVIKDKDGKRQEDNIKASTYESAIEILRKRGANQIVSVREIKGGLAIDEMSVAEQVGLAIYRWRTRVPLKSLVFFTRQLSTMFSAGLTIERAISNLLTEERNYRFKKVLVQTSADLKKGYALSEALAKHPGVFSNLYVALVHAGEISGNLHVILEQLSDYLETVSDTRRKVISALTYPVVAIIFLTSVVIFLMVVVVPMFSEVYAKFGQRLPFATRVLMNISHVIVNQAPFVILVVFMALFGLWVLFKTKRGGLAWDHVKLSFPVFGGLLLSALMEKFAKTFGILIGAGVPILEGLSHSIRVVENRVIANGLRQAQSMVKDGYAISVAMKKTGVFPPIMVQLISTGEETGEINRLLEKVSEFYAKQVDATIGRLTSLIEPLLIIMIGLVIGVILIAIYLPVFMLGRAIQAGA
ncbi:type II secretion system F family protein [bacterium]|nr:type II secretion system F family protein [bacterium]MBU1636609.1 type II secretion system F family protein [bacterium]MBU1920059.1 type II secretion system F family protein [bacterium]